MKTCTNCGKSVNDESRFCPGCGVALDAEVLAVQDQAALQEEKKCLDLFYRFFKYERLSWKIYGIVWLVLGIFYVIMGGIYMAIGFGLGAEDVDLWAFVLIFVLFCLYGILLFLPLAILNMKMVKRCENYMNTLYSDAAPMVTRCNSVGMIVLSALFNGIAMAFIIVKFVMAKTKSEQLKQIVARQKAYSQNTPPA